jgi:hypothetical protein
MASSRTPSILGASAAYTAVNSFSAPIFIVGAVICAVAGSTPKQNASGIAADRTTEGGFEAIRGAKEGVPGPDAWL